MERLEPEQPSAENIPPVEQVTEQLAELVAKIEAKYQASHERGEGDMQQAVGESGLPPEAVAEAAQETNVRERLTQNSEEHYTLAEETVASIRAVVELLAEDLPPAERRQMLEAVGASHVGFGAFYDTYRLGESHVVLKDLKLNYLFGSREAVSMMARHSLETERVKEYFGEMVPESAFVIFPEHEQRFAEEKAKYETTGKKFYDAATFARIQADRRLQTDYARRDVPGEERRGVDWLFGKAGEALEAVGMVRKESVGVMVQEHVQGITFGKFFEQFTPENCPTYETLRQNVKDFIERTRSFNEKYALLWHTFDSDNVVIETDEAGVPTGQLKVLDLNFTERSAEFVRRRLVAAFDQRMLQPLEKRFGLKDQA